MTRLALAFVVTIAAAAALIAADPPLDTRIDASRITRLEPPPLPESIILPLPPDHRVASSGEDVPVSPAHWAQARAAIARGLAALRERQSPTGAWLPGRTAEPTAGGPPTPVDVAVTALCVKALAQTHLDPDDADEAIERGIAFLQAGHRADGAFAEGDLANYVTASVVSALATADEFRFRDDVARGARWLMDAQWDQSEGLDVKQDWYGGAGYGHHGRPDLSNTQMMLEALYDAGLSPSEPAVEHALAFVSRTQNLRGTNSAEWAGSDGGFVYTPANGGESMASEAAGEGRTGELRPAGQPRSLRSYGSMTYAGFKSLLYAGLAPDDPRVRAAFDWIRRHWTFDENPGLGQQGLYYYYHVMARALRMGQQTTIADANGVPHNWREEMIDAVAGRQHPTGIWRNDADRWLEGEPILATVFAVLALQETLKPVSRFADAEAATGLRFEITYDAALTDTYTGRVYVLMSSSGRRDPRFGPQWFSPAPFVAADVVDWRPDTPLVIDASNAVTYPGPLADIPDTEYAVQAVMRLNPDTPNLGDGEGNGYAEVVRTRFGGATDATVSLQIDQQVPPRPFAETDRLRLVEIPSPMLSEFYGREVMMRASVLLPRGYDDDPRRRYPVNYVIGGFGSDHHMIRWMQGRWDQADAADDLARVVLDPRCFGGHHTFADSANNGPRGTALVEEMIPYLESTFRFVPAATARYVSGHSSGGWSSLWLQVAYPDAFGGVWSTAPDPVDFSAFQMIDIYDPNANAYVDADGKDVPVAQRQGKAFATVKDFTAMETVYGDGGQLRSFEWVFSPPSGQGGPKRLYDRETGAIDPVVADAWQAFDIRKKLEREWPEVAPRLAGKLNVICGDMDTFYLHHAVVQLKAALETLGSDAVVELVPGHDHGSLLTPELMQRMDEEMLAAFRRHHAEEAKPAVTRP